MSDKAPFITNWRDPNPYINHESAIVWSILLGKTGPDAQANECMQHIRGFAKPSLQGRKNSDYHNHEDWEQFYYILSGEGHVLIGDEKHAVSEGSVVYFPPNVYHQMFAEDHDDWMEHLIITCPVERTGSEACVFNWRDVTPETGLHGGVVTWPLLRGVEADGGPSFRHCLMGFRLFVMQRLIRGKTSDYHRHEDFEQVYYILEGWGSMLIDGTIHSVAEGDTVYLPPGVPHQILNEECDGWLSYLVVS